MSGAAAKVPRYLQEAQRTGDNGTGVGGKPVTPNQPIRRLTPAQFECLVDLWVARNKGIQVEGPDARTDHFRRLEAYGYAKADKALRYRKPKFTITVAGKFRLLDPMRLTK